MTDADLINPWGVSFISTSSLSTPFWVSDNGANASTLYSVTGSTGVAKAPLTVDIPTTSSGPQGPTGQVSNTNTSSFMLSDGPNPLSSSSPISTGRSPLGTPGLGTKADVEVTTPGVVYTGLATNQADTMLYAANNSAGTIDVFNSSFQAVNLDDNAFATPEAIAARGLVPFNVMDSAAMSM